MKISCQSCAAKYTIADEKVVGKVVKIRCKKCGSTIVVNGNEGAQASDGGGAFDYTAQPGADAAPWTVSVSETDQRTMTLAEIVAEYKAGVVNDDTYCWKDGMADWHPLNQIEELYAACSSGPRQTLASGVMEDASHASGSGLGALFSGNDVPATGGGGGGGYGESFAAASPGGTVGAAARRTGGRAPGADIFGGVEQAGGEDDVLTSAPRGGMSGSGESPGKLTGQRNENSVLFSLSALTEKAGGAPAVASPATSSSKASSPNEASGLIDIRALSASTGSSKGSDSAGRADDIMNLSGGGAFTAALAAPVLLPTAPEPLIAPIGGVSAGGQEGSGKSKTMLIVAGAVVLLLGGVVALVIALKGPATPPPVVADTKTPGPETSAAAVPAAPGPTTTPTAAEPSGASDPLAALSAKAPTVGTPPPVRAGGAVPAARPAGGGAAKPAEPVAVATPPAPAAEPAKPKSLEDAMRASAGGGAAPKAAADTGGDKQFDRGAASAAFRAGRASPRRRGESADVSTGSGHVKVTFEPKGTVSTVKSINPRSPAPPSEVASPRSSVARAFRPSAVRA
ncbi:MAG: zinc-ribbon domain-containing protein [Polyangiaceae bacterium]